MRHSFNSKVRFDVGHYSEINIS